MADERNELKCDTCGEQATMVAYDYIEIRHLNGKIDHEPCPPPYDRRYGCNDHPVEGKMDAMVSEPWRCGAF